MIDRGEVIKSLHDIDAFIAGRLGFEQAKNFLRTIDETIALLKEQEAVKPKSKSRHGEYPQIVHRCGNCNEILYRYYKHCTMCGRPVKWE